MSTTETGAAKPPAEIDVEDFSSLVRHLSRLLKVLGQIQPFSDSRLGLPEWLALTALTHDGRGSIKALVRNLGVTGPRAIEITNTLVRASLISISQSADNEEEIGITDAGKAKVDEVNSQLMPLLSSALRGKERSLFVLSKQVKFLTRSLQVGEPNKPDEAKGRRRKKAKKRAAAEA